ncbi:hypothetical protein [Sphingomonas sp. BK235]|uniref:hypothetical protein n=1 Tax=Sphingomonas sp. BK235 TaxID=2512131 RepID=UPI0010479C8D|nr:hypothetical protein [Sphingomonas sp. BK235]
MFATLLLLGLTVAPIASIVLVAGLQTWWLRGHENDRTSSALIEVMESHQPGQGLILSNYQAARRRKCDIASEKLPDWIENNKTFWSGWGPQDAYMKLDALLSVRNEKVNGRDAVRLRYIQNKTSNFERRFLVGCISSTFAAHVCETRIKSLIEAANNSARLPDQKLRFSEFEAWQEKVLCAFAKGLSASRP